MPTASIALTQGLLAGIERRMGRLDEALANAQESLELRRATHGNDSHLIVSGLTMLGSVHAARGEIPAAHTAFDEAMSILQGPDSESGLSAASARLAYGRFLLETGDTQAAGTQFEQAYATAATHYPRSSPALERYAQALSEARAVPDPVP